MGIFNTSCYGYRDVIIGQAAAGKMGLVKEQLRVGALKRLVAVSAQMKAMAQKKVAWIATGKMAAGMRGNLEVSFGDLIGVENWCPAVAAYSYHTAAYLEKRFRHLWVALLWES